MKELSFDSLIITYGGNWIDTSCDVVTAGSAVYTIGVATNWWNPVGWLAGALDVVSLACLGRWAYGRFER